MQNNNIGMENFIDPKIKAAWRQNRNTGRIKLFLTSSPCPPGSIDFYTENDFARNLREAAEPESKALYITADPKSHGFNAETTIMMRGAMERIGITFSRFACLDGRNISSAERLITSSNLIVLGGGHVPTQRRFFEEISLRDHLKNFRGVIMAISAGSMNCANTVYSSPELDGETLDPSYERFFPGLGLTPRNIVPHFNTLGGTMLDGMRLYEDIISNDSVGHDIFVLPDGTYIYSETGMKDVIHGECYLFKDKVFKQICETGKRRVITEYE